jgi:hypothetical protein
MPLPKPLTTRISDLLMDTLVIASRCSCTVGHTVTSNLRRANGKVDTLHSARLVARGLEDTGRLSNWQQRKLRQMEHLGAVEDAERRPISIKAG